MPKTRLGKWSVGLVVVFFVLLGIGQIIVRFQGSREDQTFLSNPLLSIPMLGSGAAAILAFFTGIVAIIKNKERSILVFLSTLLGLLVLIFVLGEILFPH